jgi:hypothetical protein
MGAHLTLEQKQIARRLRAKGLTLKGTVALSANLPRTVGVRASATGGLAGQRSGGNMALPGPFQRARQDSNLQPSDP